MTWGGDRGATGSKNGLRVGATDSYNSIFDGSLKDLRWRLWMPIYEYECKKCKAHTEILQKITDKPLTKCRKCGGRLEKQWSSTSFQFKGSGWYVTDYA